MATTDPPKYEYSTPTPADTEQAPGQAQGHEPAPLLPPRHVPDQPRHNDEKNYSYSEQAHEEAPALPARHVAEHPAYRETSGNDYDNSSDQKHANNNYDPNFDQAYANSHDNNNFEQGYNGGAALPSTFAGQAYAAPPLPPPPPQRQRAVDLADEDVDSPINYVRDPSKLICYLVPFPKPDFGPEHKDLEAPTRFLVYTPPPPPIPEPREGEKEGKITKVQRKWQRQIREAKTSDAKLASWKGAKGRALKGINKAINWTTSSSLDFLNRVPSSSPSASSSKATSPSTPSGAGDVPDMDDPAGQGQTVGLTDMVLVYPNSLPGTEEEIREEFVSAMLRTKSKAQRDAVIATGLLPVSLAVDVLATLVWPFGGLFEIDAVWGYSSLQGAKTARNMTKRLHSSKPAGAEGTGAGADPGAAAGAGAAAAGGAGQAQLHLHFTPSPRIEVLRRYLAETCHRRDARLWRSDGIPPTESDVIAAIGWSPSATAGATRNWEDEQWELQEVKEDLRSVMGKAAREWDKWCNAYMKNPQKALKK